jgi:PAS domain S-box-containing protein
MLDSDDKVRAAGGVIPPVLSAMLRSSDGILDILPIAACICDARGVIVQYNRRAAEIWGRAPAPGQTHDQFATDAIFYELDGTPADHSMITDVLKTGMAMRDLERVVVRPDGTRVVVSINVDPLRNAHGDVIGAVNCFLDITERKRTDEALERSRLLAHEQEQRLAATYEHAAIGIAEVDPAGRILRVNEAICDITGFAREELLQNVLFRYSHPGDTDADRQAFRKQCAGELEFYSIEKRFVRKDGRVIWMAVRSSQVCDAAGNLLYLVRVIRDVTERKAAERRQKLLTDELNHRVKNTLSTVQSLATQTTRSAPTPAAFRKSFEGRLIALSKAHEQLTEHHWESADLRALLSAGFAPFGARPGRVVLRGEDVVLRPRAVLTLAMAFHELITNAAKYGALSVPGGRVEIRWEARRAADPAASRLRIDWLEQGGPPVAAPDKRGFGSRLIEGSVQAELGGSVRLSFAPEGLRCEFLIPLEPATIDAPPAGEDWAI